jgi:HK97 family phage major capsid protein
MADNEPAVIVAAPDETQNRVDSALARIDTSLASFSDTFIERLSKLEEQSRASFTLPGTSTPKPKVGAGEWMDVALRILSGERIPDSQFRTVQDLISSDNAGLVPNAYSDELIGVIDPSRPFMASTRRLATPTSGMSLVVPVINQRPTVAEQTQEKQELSSQITKIGTKTFEMVTKGGVGDISLQLLKRADRSFLDLYLQLLAEAYAIEADTEAVRALLDAVGGVGAGTALDPEDLKLGDAYATSFDAIRRPPDTIWLSTEAIAAFIDAKASTTNQPLYPGLTASATAGGGIRGNISGLNAVHVPSLDAHGAFGIVGPANGFAWAEDGTYTLQVDVPAKAGRDVALVGMLWFAPWYPAAFTVYNVAS